MLTQNYEVLGIGAPIVDLLVRVSDEFLEKNIPGKKSGMEIIDAETLHEILRKLPEQPLTIPGGSCANTIKGLSRFGIKCGFRGMLGRDAFGTLFTKKLEELEIVPLLHYSDSPTSLVLCLITPDGERTFRGCLSACQEISSQDLTPQMFQKVRHVHIEGYSLLNSDLARVSMEYAKGSGATVSFDLASFAITGQYKELILELLEKFVDVVFANIDEIFTLTNLPPKEGCFMIKNLCKVGVILMGKEGCWVGRDNEIIHCPAYPSEVVDTTGAGDLFASGFLYGYLNNRSLMTCAKLGCLTGAAIVREIGGELPLHVWTEIRNQMSDFLDE